ncbi:MAG: hypothetical protein ACLT8E_02850 [Akkermansia sp.]
MNRSAIDNYFVRKSSPGMPKSSSSGAWTARSPGRLNEVSSPSRFPEKSDHQSCHESRRPEKPHAGGFMAWAVEGAAKNVEEEK